MGTYITNIGLKALQENHVEIVETIDTKEIQAFFFQNGFLSDPIFMPCSNVRQERSEYFMQCVYKKKLSLECFFHGIESTYPFLIDTIKISYNNIKMSEHSNIEKLRFCSFGPEKRRIKCLKIRHKMKRLFQNGDINQFENMRNDIQQKWKDQCTKNSMDPEDKKALADMYFMTLDAECEMRRGLLDRTLYKDKSLFQKLLETRFHVTNPCIPEAMWIARLASAKLMTGENTRNCLEMLKDAKEKLSLCPPCRESGIVIYIEYNMLWLLWEEGDASITIDHLISVAETAAKHFSEETEEIRHDFHRMILIKVATLCLNIGLFQNYIGNDENIPEKYVHKASEALKYIDRNISWGRMENRWKSNYCNCKARLCFVKGQFIKGHMFLKYAINFAQYAKLTDDLYFMKLNYKKYKSSLHTLKYYLLLAENKGLIAVVFSVAFYLLCYIYILINI